MLVAPWWCLPVLYHCLQATNDQEYQCLPCVKSDNQDNWQILEMERNILGTKTLMYDIRLVLRLSQWPIRLDSLRPRVEHHRETTIKIWIKRTTQLCLTYRFRKNKMLNIWKISDLKNEAKTRLDNFIFLVGLTGEDEKGKRFIFRTSSSCLVGDALRSKLLIRGDTAFLSFRLLLE